jgi:Zn-dependent protease
MPPVLAASINYGNPLFWAVFIAWIMSVVLHEFAHGLVAHWGGDYTLSERGGLSLNPLQYVNPVTSLLLPAIFLILGGVPLPGGATYVRRDLLRNRTWESAVSLAGPLANLLLFLAGAVALHPRVGWVPDGAPAPDWTNAQQLVGALTILQFVTVLLNLIPLPPLDGFGAVSPFLLPTVVRDALSTPPVFLGGLLVLFVVLRNLDFYRRSYALADYVLTHLGYDADRIDQVGRAFNFVIFGSSW